VENKKRLSEALKRHQLLVEYNFYLQRGMDEQDAPPAPEAGGEEGLPVPEAGGEEALPTPEELTGAPAPTTPAPELPMPEEPKPNEEGEVEVDITDLVTSTKDTKDKIDGTNELLNNLISKFDELETKISTFDQFIDKIDRIEQDIEKRLPTPTEKLEMRSMYSYPYNLKLTDFWKEETEDIDNQEVNKQTQEYVLTPEDIKKDYSSNDIKNSFDQDYVDNQR
jgi:hypothetical protein